MASYGSFETNREIASGHGSVVYSAHKAGESASTYAVKVFSLQPHISDDQESRESLTSLLEDLNRSFTNRVTLQKKGAESSKFIAPVFEFGTAGGNAWYATKLYPRSVHKIIEGRVALSYEGLYHIIHSVLTGTLDLKKACGRSHGELKSENILIGGGARITETDVVISDPLPGDESEAQRYELADLRAIGEIIYQLVRQRELTEASDWLIFPIEPSAEWTKLFGKNSAAWLALCNRLLDPKLSLEDYSLSKLETDLIALEPKPAVSKRTLAIVAGVIVVAVIGLVILLNRPTRIVIESKLAAVEVFEGGKLLVKTSAGKSTKIKLPPGPHTLTAHFEGLSDVTNSFQLAKGETKTVVLAFEYGTVHLQSQPANANVLVNGIVLGKTPLTLFQKPGSIGYQLDLGKDFETARLTATIEANKEVTLTSVLKPLSVQGEDAIVEFGSDPDGAKLFLNGKESDEMPARKLVPSGTNQVTAQFRDWPPQTATLILKPGQKTNYTFNFDYGRVGLRSDPGGATVWVGKYKYGPTPTEMLSSTGTVAFRFERPGYEVTNLTSTVPKGGRITLNPTLISTNAILEVTSDLTPALITATSDQNVKYQLGNTTSKAALVTNLPPGTYTVSAHFGDLADKVITKQAPKGVPTAFVLNFDYGTVQLNSQPPNATVTAGANALGAAPQRVFQRPDIRYNYTFNAPDYEPFETNVAVGLKASANVNASLLPAKVSVALSSDPPAATLFDENGNTLGAVEQIQNLRWGEHKLTAKYPGLDPVQEVLQVGKKGGSPHLFQFSYGTVSITSAPAGAVILDSVGQRIGVTPTNLNVKLGKVSYQLVFDNKTSNVTAVVRTGLNPMGTSFGLAGKVYESALTGMLLVWVDKLPPSKEGGKEGGFVGRYEVTQAEYEKVMGTKPSHFTGNPRLPVENVSWTNAKEFCRKLTEAEKDKLTSGMHYDLPSESQWTFFAADAKSEDGIVKRTDADGTATVGSKAANKYGLYDIIGNVWEWCDGLDPQKKPSRGYAFNSTGGLTRFAPSFTSTFDADLPRSDIGFRIVLVP